MRSPPFPKQHQPMPGRTAAMRPKPDHGEDTYRGVLVAYLSEDEDARETERLAKAAGRKAVLSAAISAPPNIVIEKAVKELGGIGALDSLCGLGDINTIL
jgi:hypothetical protein